MASLSLTVALFFLFASLVLFWLSRVVHVGLLDDAILSLGFSLTALGLSLVLTYGLPRGMTIVTLLLAI